MRFEYENGLEIEIFQGDLAVTIADVIVNAANRNLLLGGGVAQSILKHGGYKVQDECDKYKNEKRISKLNDGDVMHTKSYMNNCKYIIHAVGPDSFYYKNNDEKCFEVLNKTFYNVLKYANEELNAQSVALPLISSGIFGVPKNVCCNQLYLAIDEFVRKTNSKSRNLKYIKIPSIDYQTNNELLKTFSNFLKLETKAKKIKNENTRESFDNNNDEKPNQNKKEFENKKIIVADAKGTCTVCKCDNIKLILRLDCGCNYCKACVPNYEQNKKCECVNKN